jgi:muramoyltetrapeptide carboxypeptidase
MSPSSKRTINHLLKPKPLQPGACIGIATPSFPGHIILQNKFEKGVNFLKAKGFKIKLGQLTASSASQGYRTGSAAERANEFNSLYKDPEVDAVIFSIGGANSSSLLPYLDYDFIKANPKIVCGYSDVTSIHAALNSLCGLCTFYGPAIIPSFGNHPEPDTFTFENFLIQTGYHGPFETYEFPCPSQYSDHFIDATQANWTSVKRIFKKNEGWKTLRKGRVTGQLFSYNLNTLVTLAGTPYFPALQQSILCIEQMNTNMANEERTLTQLLQTGVFDKIQGLIISKPEKFDFTHANIRIEELLTELLPSASNFPVVLNFDCGHTHPMLTIAQGVQCTLSAFDSVSLIQHECGFS